MSEDCPRCVNGWIQIGDNTFDMCDCLLGQAMRRPGRFILHRKPETKTNYLTSKDDTDPNHEAAFQWFKAKYEGKAT